MINNVNEKKCKINVLQLSSLLLVSLLLLFSLRNSATVHGWGITINFPILFMYFPFQTRTKGVLVEDPQFERHCRTITSCRCELSKWLSSVIITSGKKQMTACSRYVKRDRAKALLRI